MRRQNLQGSVVLVALSCVTVLGIALASFLALSNQAMKLSNRTYALSVSRQLANMGLERALRSYNANTFSSWTLSGATATRTLSIASSHYGNSGITASVNLRVEHYLDTRKATSWNAIQTYAVGDYVWYFGVWYQCTAVPPAGTAPLTTSYWKSAPAIWNLAASYQVGNVVYSGGAGYRCIVAHVNQAPPNSTYWTSVTMGSWSAATAYAVDDLIYSGGMPYRCISSHTNHAPPNSTYWLAVPAIYAEGVAVLPDSSSTTLKTQVRATLAPASLFPNAVGSANLTSVNSSSLGTVDSYNSVLGYYGQVLSPGGTNIGASAIMAGAKSSGTAVVTYGVRVNGYVAAPSSSSSPYDPQWTYTTSSGVVTASTATTTPSPKVDLTRVSRSPYVPQFDILGVSPTTINYLANPSGTVNLPRGGDNVNAADGKYYYYTSTTLDVNSGDILNINGPVVIDVRPSSSANFWVRNGGRIVITNNATASLEVHFAGQLVVGSGSSSATCGIQNLTVDPRRCVLLSSSTTNTVNTHYFLSDIAYYGVIYMPNAYLTMWNSGFNEQIYGALSASNVYFTHNVYLHYDTSLRTSVISGVDNPYEIAEWRELTDPTERITLP